MPSTYREGKEKKGARYGVPEPGTVKSGGFSMDAHGAQKPLGGMTLPKPGSPAKLNESTSGRKRGKSY